MGENKYFINNYGGLHGTDIVTPIGRAAFLYLNKPNVKFDPPKYGLTFLFDKTDEQVKTQLRAIQALCVDMAEEFCKNLFAKEKPKMQYEDFKKSIMAGFAAQPIFRDGNTQKYDGFADHWYIVAKNEKRSGFTIMDDQIAEAFESGMLVRGQVQPYLDKKGFSYKLRGIRLVKDDGKRFTVAPDGGSLLRGIDDAVAAVTIAGDASVGQAFDNAVGATAGAAIDVL